MPIKFRVKNPRAAEAVSQGQFYFHRYRSINEETLHMLREKDSSCNLYEEEKVVVRNLYVFTWNFNL